MSWSHYTTFVDVRVGNIERKQNLHAACLVMKSVVIHSLTLYNVQLYMYLYSIVRIGTNVVWPNKIPLLGSDYTSGPVHLANIGKIPRAVHSLVGPGFQLGKQQEKQVELL